MEDHVGDMDFKVAGSRAGITAIQLDIKVQSITFDVIRDALEQAKEARLFILDRIRETISESRTEMSPYAPRIERISVPVDKIGIIIGPGGKTIRGIVEQTKATVDVQDDGTVLIGSADADSMRRAVGMVQDLVREVKVGEIYTGKVVKIMTFGAFVQLLPGKDGLVHISELADHRVPTVEDVVSVGEEVTVIVTEIDNLGRVNLSRRALLEGSSDSQDGSADGPPTPEGQQGDRPQRPDDAQSPPSYPRSRPGGERSGYRPQGPRQGGQRGRPRSGPGETPGYRPQR
jgi:polyribonucleotide nucleotidyltransferase